MKINFANHTFLPFMLSPMAGVTNLPFRSICANFAQKAVTESITESVINSDDFTINSGMYINEMLSARALTGNINKVRAKLSYADNELFRSCQLYVLDPQYSYLAAKQIVSNNLADHIDLNFGCPVKKVTKNGGGSVIPAKPELLRELVKAVKNGINDGIAQRNEQLTVPLSAKFRLGIDDDEIFYLRTAEICVEEGCELLTLHARTTAQFYSGEANWSHIKILRENTPKNVLVFGNGDIWSASDAKRMMDSTNADGVCIGRGAVGRPWLFYDLANLFIGNNKTFTPDLREVCKIILSHFDATLKWIFEQNKQAKPISSENVVIGDFEKIAMRSFRAHIGGYLKGFSVGGLKSEIMRCETRDQLDKMLQSLDLSQKYPVEVGNMPRGRRKEAKKVFLPHNW